MKLLRGALSGAMIVGLGALVGCAGGDAETAAADAPATSALELDAEDVTQAVEASTAPAESPLAGEPPAPAATGLRLQVAAEGNEARYRVSEILVGFELPNDAVGTTDAVSGGITLDASGAVIPSASSILVNITGLSSDKDRRDGYLQNRLLQGAEHPTVELVPTELRGLTLPLPTTGSRTLELLGDLTIKGVTRPTRWQVDARFGASGVTGSAVTAFTFEEFGITKPRVPAVLSVADSIRLEYDFNLAASPTTR